MICYILFGQNHLYVKMLFNRDSIIQSTFRRLCTACKSEDFWFPVSRPDDVSSRSDAHLSTVPSVWTTYHTVRTTWIPVRTRSFIRQELQFKFNCSDICQHGPDAHSTDMEIVYSTSTIRTPASHGPDARLSDMEIAC
jgi:hypothetical protein